MTRSLEVQQEEVKGGGERGCFSFSLKVKGSPGYQVEMLGISPQCSKQGRLHYFFFTSE